MENIIVVEGFSKPKYNTDTVLALATVTVNGVTVKHYKVQVPDKTNDNKLFISYPTKGYKDNVRRVVYIKDATLKKEVFTEILAAYKIWAGSNLQL